MGCDSRLFVVWKMDVFVWNGVNRLDIIPSRSFPGSAADEQFPSYRA